MHEHHKPRTAKTDPATGDAPSPETGMAEYASGLGRRALNTVGGFGRRVFVHLAAVVCAFTVWGVTQSATAGISVYTGLICLLARGMSATPQWLGPFGVGIVQMLVLLVAGVFPPFAVFWGGAQTWVQRLFLKKLHMGSEWFALLLLLPGAIRLLAAESPPVYPLPVSFVAVGIAGRVAVMALCRARGAANAVPGAGGEPEKVARHRASLAGLAAKLPLLPRRARTVTETIVAATEHILECMARDAGDLEPGHRFLNRYLAAVHSLADKHIRLARENVITPDIADALAKSEETLSRLGGVFQKEYEYLLKNDVVDFSADLAVIDALLKMDGREKPE